MKHHDPLSHRIRDFLDHHDPDLVLAALRARRGGPAHMRRLGSMARALVKSGARPRRILDLYCGPGDLGRTLGLLEPESTVDFLDPDDFALALCGRINRRRRVRGRLVRSDPWELDWAKQLEPGYEVVAISDGLCRLDEERAAEVLSDAGQLLVGGGQLLLCEPTPGASPTSDDEAVDAEWKAFFRRLDRHLGSAAHRGLVSRVPPGCHPIDDEGLPVRRYLRLLRDAGFGHAEIVQKSGRHVSIRAVRRDWSQIAA